MGVGACDGDWLRDPEPVPETEPDAEELGVDEAVGVAVPEGDCVGDDVPAELAVAEPVPLPDGAALSVPLPVAVAPAEAEPLELGVPVLLDDSEGEPVCETDVDGPHTVFSALSHTPGKDPNCDHDRPMSLEMSEPETFPNTPVGTLRGSAPAIGYQNSSALACTTKVKEAPRLYAPESSVKPSGSGTRTTDGVSETGAATAVIWRIDDGKPPAPLSQNATIREVVAGVDAGRLIAMARCVNVYCENVNAERGRRGNVRTNRGRLTSPGPHAGSFSTNEKTTPYWRLDRASIGDALAFGRSSPPPVLSNTVVSGSASAGERAGKRTEAGAYGPTYTGTHDPMGCS